MKLLINLCAHDGIVSHYTGVGTMVKRYIKTISKILKERNIEYELNLFTPEYVENSFGYSQQTKILHNTLKIYQLIDKMTPDYITKLQELSYYLDYQSDIEYLNLNHKTWCYPWNNKQHFSTSFLDLYELAAESAIKTIKEVTDLLEQKYLDTNKIKKIFLDLSYITGKPCHKRLEFKYFYDRK